MSEMTFARTAAAALAGLVLTLSLLWLVTAVTFAGVFRAKSPGLALSLLAIDARAMAGQAQQMITRNARRPPIGRARALASAALRRDPTAIEAVTTLGVIAVMQGRMSDAERAFGYAERLSRRDRLTQIWWIERKVAEDDVEGALRHYDIALRTSRGLRSVLFPILMQAVATPHIADAVNRLLRQNPNWKAEFLTRAVWEMTNPAAMVSVTRGLLDPRVEAERTLLMVELRRLADMGQYEAAWNVYRRLPTVGASAAAPLRDGDFATDPRLPPFDWVFSDAPDLTPERRERDGGDGYALYLPQEGEGLVARQLLRLAPGRHQLRALVGSTDAAEGDRPYIRLNCATGGGQLILSPFPQAQPEGAPLALSFEVPSNCPFQWIAIGVRRPSGAPQRSPSWIAQLRLL